MYKLPLFIAIVAVILCGIMYFGDKAPTGATFNNYRTSSSTAYSVGSDISTTVLESKGSRRYASFCNHSNGNQLYLIFSSTVTTATTSGAIIVDVDECFELKGDQLYTGEVQVIQENATTTNSLLVSELRN